MSSSQSFFPWDFVRAQRDVVNPSNKGLFGYHFFDPFVEKIILSKMPKTLFEGDHLHILSGSEITVEWLEENIKGLDLFSTNSSYLVLQADQMSKKVKDFILEEMEDWGERYFILVFHGDLKYMEKLAKKNKGEFYKIEAPRFWEAQKLLQFLCEQTHIQLSYDIQSYIVEAIPNQAGDFIGALKTIALHFPKGQKMELKKVKEILHTQRLDQFVMASNFCERKWQKFYPSLIDGEFDFDTLRTFFAFMQGHLHKVADTSYTQGKSRLSKYDNQILAHAKMWKAGDLREEMRFFGELEILAKQKSHTLQTKLKERLISTYI